MKHIISLPENSEELLIHRLSSTHSFPRYFCSAFKVALIKKDFKTCNRIVNWITSQSVVDISFNFERKKIGVTVYCGEEVSSLYVPFIHAEWYYLLSSFATEEISKEYDTN